jgi:hypothetical protein
MAAERDTARIPVILCIDAEPDQFFTDPRRAEAWRGFEAACDFFRTLRERSGHRAWRDGHLNWFFRMDPQIAETYGSAEWPLRYYERAVADIDARGDPIGLHVHAYRWSAAHNSWMVDFESQSWIDCCLSVSFDAYRNVLGRRCLAFRFGDRWMNNETAHNLERRGVLYDLTLEPGLPARPPYFTSQPSTGELPDYSNVPASPYRPSRHDFRVPRGEATTPERNGTWMIPISTGLARPSFTHGIVRRLLGRGSNTAVMTAAVASIYPTLFRQVVNAVLQREQPYLAVALRTDAFVNQRSRRRVETNLDILLSHPLASRFAWTSPPAALAMLALHPATTSSIAAAT